MSTSLRALLPTLGAAAAMILIAVALAFVIAGRPLARDPATAAATPSSLVAVAPSPTPTRRPTPRPAASSSPSPSASPTPSPKLPASPSPTAAPELVVPTVGPADADGVKPPLSQLDIAGGDQAVIDAIERSVARLETLDTYRFTAGVTGRSVLDLSEDSGLNLAMRGDVSTVNGRRIDALVSLQMVEFDGSAAITSTDHIVIIGKRGWSIRPGQEPEAIPAGSATFRIIGILLPAGIAERSVIPFAAGYERVGVAQRDGKATIHYRATAAGRAAYAAVTGLDRVWSADLWIDRHGGYLVALEIRARPLGDNGGFLSQIELTDVNDPAIVIKAPA